MTGRPRSGAARALVLLALVAGCTPAPEEGAFRVDGAQILADAREAGASPEQLAVLELAVERGSMSFEDLASLQPAAIECIEAAGLRVLERPPEEVFPGVMRPTFLVESSHEHLSEEEMRAQWERISSCTTRHTAFADTFYVDQPSSVEAHDAALLDAAEEIRACLAERHVELAPGAKAGEIVGALAQDAEANGSLVDWTPCYEGGSMLVEW